MSGIGPVARTIEEIAELIEHVWTTRQGSCWIWTRYRTKKGYGLQGFDGKKWRAHRLSYLAFKGQVPDLIRHKCDRPECVNPDHLEPGTAFDNAQDAKKRGRRVGNPGRLTHEERHELQDRAQSGESCSSLAEEFHVGVRYVRKLRSKQ